MEESKVCARCKRDLPRERFGKDRTRPDGLFPYCAECRREAVATSVAKYREKYRERARQRYQDNEPFREAIKARSRAAYIRDPETWKTKVKAWQAANAVRVHEIKLASSRRRYAIEPEPQREAWRRRYALKQGTSVVPFTVEQLAGKVRYWGNRCWVCGGAYDAIDHVKPLNKGGYHILANLRPICKPCNTRKKDRWPYIKGD